MNKTLCYLAFLLGVTSGVHTAMARDEGLPFPTAGRPALRITDEAIAADREAMRALQRRVDALAERSKAIDRYQLAKAKAWLDFAVFEYSQNDRTGVIEAAIGQAIRLLQGLEAGVANLSQDTPIIRGSRLVREDLWARARELKVADSFKCAEATIARLEVQLVLTGHEIEEADWHNARRAERIAEQLATDAQLQIDRCPVPVITATVASAAVLVPEPLPAPIAPPVVIAPPEVAPPQGPILEKISLSADALFAFDKFSLVDMSPIGRARLDELATKLGGDVRIEGILITGHSDRLGGPAINQQRSEARARTVQQYLASRGVPIDTMQAVGVGASKPIVHCEGKVATKQLIICLLPNRRVEIEVRGVRGPETMRPAGAPRP
jgi:OmpA-OmpF porin, OOP family